MNIKAVSTDTLNKIKARDWKGIPAAVYGVVGAVVLLLVALLVFLCSGSSIKSDEDFLALYDDFTEEMKEVDKDAWRKAKSERADIVKALKGDGGLGDALEFALAAGSKSALVYLIDEKGAKLRDKHLGLVSLGGHMEIVEYLIDEHGLTPDEETLLFACRGGQLDICKYLVKKHQVDASKSKFLIALCADKDDYKEAAKMLSLVSGKEVKVDDVKESYVEVAEFLMEQGADPKDKLLQAVLEKSDNSKLNALLRKEAK